MIRKIDKEKMYQKLFSESIHEIIVHVMKTATKNVRSELCKMRKLWKNSFTIDVLKRLDAHVQEIDPLWPYTSIKEKILAKLRQPMEHFNESPEAKREYNENQMLKSKPNKEKQQILNLIFGRLIVRKQLLNDENNHRKSSRNGFVAKKRRLMEKDLKYFGESPDKKKYKIECRKPIDDFVQNSNFNLVQIPLHRITAEYYENSTTFVANSLKRSSIGVRVPLNRIELEYFTNSLSERSSMSVQRKCQYESKMQKENHSLKKRPNPHEYEKPNAKRRCLVEENGLESISTKPNDSQIERNSIEKFSQILLDDLQLSDCDEYSDAY